MFSSVQAMALLSSSKHAVRGSTRGAPVLLAFGLIGPAITSFVHSGPLIKSGRFVLDVQNQRRAGTQRQAGGVGGWLMQGWLQDPDATAWLQELASKDWKKTATQPEADVEVLSLTKTLGLPQYGRSGPVLFSRKATRVAWKATFKLLENPKMTRLVAILGRPGIGTSMSLFHGLRDLVRREHPPNVIIFEARPARRVFRFAVDSTGSWKASSMDMADWKPGSNPDLWEPNNWHFIDASKVTDNDAILFAKIVKASSPDPEHWSDFIKDGGACAYMGDWTLDEVEAAYEHLETEVDISEVRRRHSIVGGNLRLLLGTEADFKAYVKRMDSDVNDERVVNAFRADFLMDTPSHTATRLFTYATSDGMHEKMTFVTPMAFQKVVTAHYVDVVDRIGLEDFVTKFFLVGGLQRIKESGDTIRLDARVLKYVQDTSSNTGYSLTSSNKTQAFAIADNQVLRSFDTAAAFEKAWKGAMQKQSLGGEVWQVPPGYPAFDVLVDYNHAVSIAKSRNRKHSLGGELIESLDNVGAGAKGFTLTVLTMQDPQKFQMEGSRDEEAAAALTDDGAIVQVVQIPQTPQSIP